MPKVSTLPLLQHHFHHAKLWYALVEANRSPPSLSGGGRVLDRPQAQFLKWVRRKVASETGGPILVAVFFSNEVAPKCPVHADVEDS